MRWLYTIWGKLRSNIIFSFILVALLSWGVENLFSTTMQTAGIDGLFRLLAVVLIPVLVVIGVRELLPFLRNEQPILVGRMPPQQRGLIFLFNNDTTLNKAIQHHKVHLEYLWLIVTAETDKRADDARAKLDESIVAFEERIENPWDPNDVVRAVQRSVRHANELKVSNTSLACDVTGGTKAMTIGAVAGAQSEGLIIQMVPAKYDQDLKAQIPMDPIELRIL